MVGTFLIAIVVSDARVESPTLGGSNKHRGAKVVVVDIIIVSSIKIASGLAIVTTTIVADLVGAMRGAQRGRTGDRAGVLATAATVVGTTAALTSQTRRVHRNAIRASAGCTNNMSV